MIDSMKRVIRRGVFETNSSSTHSITITQKEEYEKWEQGKLLLADGNFITKEEAIKELKGDKWFIQRNPNFDFNDKEALNNILRDYEYQTCDQYFDDDELETFEKTYTTKNGDTVVAFGKYGYNG